MIYAKPVGHMILISIPKDKEKEVKTTDGGIIIPDSVIKENTFVPADVIEVGPKVTMCRLGDRIVVAKNVGNEMNYDGANYLLLNENSIGAIITEDWECKVNQRDAVLELRENNDLDRSVVNG